MEPLRIRCQPAAFIWYDRWLPFDGILGHAWMLDTYGAAFYSLPTLTPVSPEIDLVDLQLPLERRYAHTEQWYWAASWADMDKLTIDRKRLAWVRGYPFADAVHYHRDSSKKKDTTVMTVAGPDKLYNVPLYVRVVDELIWYVIGDLAEVERLLTAYIPAVGKKQTAGWGRLQSYPDGHLWQVESWPHDWSEQDGDGNLTRGIPARQRFDAIDWLNGADGIPEGGFVLRPISTYGVRVPYFVHLNQFMLEMPE